MTSRVVRHPNRCAAALVSAPLRCSWARVMSAFQSAHPRPRAQVASSRGRPRRNTSLLSSVKNVQAIARSHAGSPMAAHPKSMTARSSPSATSRFEAATSPCTQTGARSHVLASAPSHTSVAASALISPARSWMGCEHREACGPVHARGVALDPSVDRPPPRESLPRLSHGHWLWDTEWKIASEDGQPMVLLVDLRYVGVRAREAHG